MLLRDLAYQRFKQRLYANQLTPGQFVSQRELAEMLDVPLGPMREAIQRLEAAGLMRIIAQRGMQILEPSPLMVSEAYELRIILELSAVRRIPAFKLNSTLTEIEKRTKEMIPRLRDPLEMETVIELLEVDWQLHEYLIDSMDNQTISQVYRTNADKIRLARFRQKFTAEQLNQAMEEHLTVIEALQGEDPEKSTRLLETHLRTSLERGLGITSLFARRLV